MRDPLVCCICLTADRQALTDRAVKCFVAQTYPEKELLIFDTGATPYRLPVGIQAKDITIMRPSVCDKPEEFRAMKIGTLRNMANRMAAGADIIAHWDSDDWSAPERLAIQVPALRMHPKYKAVGFHNLLFLDSRARPRVPRMTPVWEYDYRRGDQALGTSLVYWRRTWEKQAFVENRVSGEDTEWVKAVGVRGLNGVCEPLLIAEVHGANTSPVYSVFDDHKPHHQPEWRRAPEFDSYCREKLYP